MYVITVIPIARGISKETLTYLCMHKLKEGSLIDVPLRRKVVKAIVLNVEDAKSKKLALKSSGFILKKIDSLREREFLPKWIMEIAEKISDHYATSKGAVLYALFSKNIFDNEIKNFISEGKNAAGEIKVVEGRFDFRIKKYEEIIQENLKDNKSSVILFPTLDSLDRVEEQFKNEFKDKVISFSGKITKKKFLKNIEKLKDKNACVILTTGSFLLLLPSNTRTIIIEEENSRWYKTRNRPYVNFIKIVEEIAKALSLDIIYGDILQRSETFALDSNIEKENQPKLQTKIIYSKTKEELESLRRKKTEYEPLDEEMRNEMSKILGNKGNVFIWVPRYGYSPIVLCHHCGETVKCHKCDSPVVLHLGKAKAEENYFLCHHCGEKRSALEKCEACQSWKLGSFGIGVERIEEAVKKEWKDEIVQIEIGTEKAIYDLRSMYDLIVIPSIDSLLSLPDFNIDERLYRTILLLKEKTRKKMIIGTKYKNNPLISFIQSESSNDFHKEMLEKRKKFGYPPFKTFIKITLKGKKAVVARQVGIIKNDLEKWRPSTFPAFIKTVNNQFIIHTLLKIDQKNWPDQELLEYLRTLPPSVEINVDPESLL